MIVPIYKDWQGWLDEDGFVGVEEQEKLLDILFDYNNKFDQQLKELIIDSATNYILIPNVNIIKEYNVTFVELMKNHSHKYNTRRMIPIQIIRNLIDVAAALQAYNDSVNKKQYVEAYHNGEDYAKINGKYIKHYVKDLNINYPFVLDLYEECCRYVHASYYQAKSNSVWHYSVKPGRYGFMGAYYKVKFEDFENDLIEGLLNYSDIPFDYEEEIDITNYCIKVNDMLLELVQLTKSNDY